MKNLIKKQIANRIYYLTTNINTTNHLVLFENSIIVIQIEGDRHIIIKGMEELG